MTSTIPYSAQKDDLFFPARRGDFFASGLPRSDSGLCAEMSRLVYARKEPEFGFDKEVIARVVANIGFENCLFFESDNASEQDGTHCFVATRSGPSPSERIAVVAFRGTDAQDPRDLEDDAEFLLKPWGRTKGNVNTGFLSGLLDVLPALEPQIALLNGRVLYTGHSLGAAMATLLVSVRAPSALYTYGSPRVGDADFVATLRGVDNHRYVDCADVVTRVPPEGFDYQHFGDPYYIGFDRMVRFNPGDLFMQRDRLAASLNYTVKYSWRWGDNWLRSLADHAPINYVWALE